MPIKAPSPCPVCSVLVPGGGRCEQHRREARQRSDAERGNSHQRGYTWRWRNYARQYLKQHPLCECPDCKAGELRTIPAEVVDHITPHRGDERLFWNPDNHQAMSKRCHDRKTAREDGGFGHAIG